jgi:hypothetical protein
MLWHESVLLLAYIAPVVWKHRVGIGADTSATPLRAPLSYAPMPLRCCEARRITAAP